MTALFTYRPLDTGVQEIRVLDIEPFPQLSSANSNEIVEECLRCRIRHVSLAANTKPSYETVSYCWGDPKPSEVVSIGEQLLKVPIHTFKVLTQLALPSQTRTLWIDAIWINQTDQEERGQQVAQMGQIYSNGTANLIYLGDDEPTTRRALQNVYAIQRELEESLQEGQSWMDLVWPYRRSLRPLRTELDLDALVALYSCPWFTRLWVVQEAILAVKNVCIRGSIRFEPTAFLAVPIVLFTRYYEHLPSLLRQLPGFYNVGLLWQVQQSFDDSTAGSGVVLYRALTVAQELECSEPCDKVFAVLGITRMTSSPRIVQAANQLLRPDYAKSRANVYRDATRFCVVQSGRLDVLSEVTHRSNHDLVKAGCASWTLPLDRRTDQRTDVIALTPVNASSEILHDLADANWPVREGTLGNLNAYGFVVDVIAECTATLEPDFTTGNVMTAKLRQFLDSAVMIAERSGKSVSDLGRTLTANRDLMSRPWPEKEQLGQLASLREQITIQTDTRLQGSELLINDEANMEISQFRAVLEQACRYRRLLSTAAGVLGLAPAVAQIGDVVAFLYPARNPCVLRPTGQRKHMFLGECYVAVLRNDHDIEHYPRIAARCIEWFNLC